MGMRICSGDTLDTDYDAESRLFWMLQDGKVFRFWYDAFGRLARLDTNGVVRSYFLWDGDHLFAEMRGSDGHRAGEYSYYGLDRLHAFLDSAGTPHYAHTDGRGNVIALTNGQNIKSQYAYDPWGQAIASTSSSFGDRDRARYKGALWLGPELDLYYLRNRWYGPKEGRFLSEDPIGLAGGINLYTFVGNDPVNGSDPSGLWEFCRWTWSTETVETEPYTYEPRKGDWVCTDVGGGDPLGPLPDGSRGKLGGGAATASGVRPDPFLCAGAISGATATYAGDALLVVAGGTYVVGRSGAKGAWAVASRAGLSRGMSQWARALNARIAREAHRIYRERVYRAGQALAAGVGTYVTGFWGSLAVQMDAANIHIPSIINPLVASDMAWEQAAAACGR